VAAAVLVLAASFVRAGPFDEPARPRPATAPTAVGPAPAPGSGLPTATDPLDGPAMAADVLVKLLAVLALAYAALWALRRYTQGTALGRPGSLLEVLETTHLGPNRTLYLVRAGDKRLLIGATPSSMATLATWETEDAAPAAAVPPPD